MGKGLATVDLVDARNEPAPVGDFKASFHCLTNTGLPGVVPTWSLEFMAATTFANSQILQKILKDMTDLLPWDV